MNDVKFISYDGARPTLCNGKLAVEINGVECTFGIGGQYPRFWISGGRVGFSRDWSKQYVEAGNWKLSFDRKRYPDWICSKMHQLIYCFNNNVQHGCCGGCL